MPYRLVMFDFDGTLADSFPVFLKVFDQLADRYRFRRLDRGAIEAMRWLTARQLMRHHEVAGWKVPFIARHARALMAAHIDEVRLFDGIGPALEQLHQAGVTLAVVSSNSPQNIAAVLGPQNLARFQHLECGISLFGKAARLRRLMRRLSVEAGEAILVGDEIRDAEAAREAGIAFGAVSWGYTRPEALGGQGPRESFATAADLDRLAG